jgi:hypothetical protein
MTLEQAMAIIARAQQALISQGFSVGAWGPCKDGVDGRWGQDSRTGWGEAMTAYGYEPAQTTALLATLGVSEFDGSTLQRAINTWNSWRRTQEVGSVAYEVAATRALAEATGITQETCGAAPPAPEPSAEPTTDMYYPPQPPKEGVAWWLWLLLGLVVAAAVGGGIWGWSKYKKKGRRKKKKKSLNGFSSNTIEAGTEVTDAEFGGDDEVDDDDVT